MSPFKRALLQLDIEDSTGEATGAGPGLRFYNCETGLDRGSWAPSNCETGLDRGFGGVRQ